MSIAIVLTFIVCWTPYYLLGLWYWFSPEMLTRQKVPPALSHILFLFGLFNTCLDPLVYGLFTVHFRREMWRACRCSRRRQEQDTAAAALTGSFRASTAPGRAGSSLGGPGSSLGVASGSLEGAGSSLGGAERRELGVLGRRCELCRRRTAESFM